MNVRTRWAIVLGLILATVTSTMLISNNIPVVVKDANGVNQTFATIQTAAGALVAEAGICDGQAAANCATVRGSSSAAAATDSAMVVALTPNSPAVTSPQVGTFSWPPGTVPITSGGTLTTSATAGSNFVAPVAIGSAPTITVSPTAGSNNVNIAGSNITLTTSASSTSLATITSPQVNSAVPIGVVGITSTVVTSNSVASGVAPVNCISGCSASTLTGTYNQNPATLASGATYAFQSDQNGALKVNITSQLASALTVSPQAGSVSWPPGVPQGISTGQAAANVTGSLVMGEAATAPIAVASASTVNLLTDLNSQLRVAAGASTSGGCTAQYVTASTSSIITNIKQSAGTLCWLRIVNASTVTATVRLYDTASVNQQAVCGGSTLPVSYDLVQPNTISPGAIANLGTAGMAFANGIQLCLTGSAGGTFGFQDQTSLTTNALFVNLGFK